MSGKEFSVVSGATELTKIEREAREAVRKYVHDRPLGEVHRFCRTADDWHDGNQTMMWKFARQNGRLDSAQEYQDLGNECQWALKGVQPAFESEREPLAALAAFAFRVASIERSLLDIADRATILAGTGVTSHYVTGIVQLAISEAAK